MDTNNHTPSVGEEIGGLIGKEIGSSIGKEVEKSVTGKTATPKKRKSPIARRIGYVVGIFFALIALWVIGNFDTWGWKFITDEWSQVDRIVRLSLIVDIIVYGIFIIHDGRILYYCGKLASNAVAFVVGIRMFQVFPFDFSYLFGGWRWLNSLFPVLIIIGVVGIGITFIVRTVRLAAGKEIYE